MDLKSPSTLEGKPKMEDLRAPFNRIHCSQIVQTLEEVSTMLFKDPETTFALNCSLMASFKIRK